MPKLETWRVTPSLLESLCGLCLSRPWNVLNRFSSSCSSRSSAGERRCIDSQVAASWRTLLKISLAPCHGADSWHMAGSAFIDCAETCSKVATYNFQLLKCLHFQCRVFSIQYRIVPGTVTAVTKIAWKKKFGITKPPEEAKAFPPSRSTPRKLSTKMDLAVEGWVKAWSTQKMVKGRVLVKQNNWNLQNGRSYRVIEYINIYWMGGK